MALENIGKFFGSFYAGYNQPYQEYKNRQADEALQKIIELERQRGLAQQTASQPVPEGMATVAPPQWGKEDKLKLYQQYGRAGLDPKAIAEAQTAQLAAEAFANAIPNITSDAGRINIGMGKEYRPDVYRADEIKADDAQIRLNTIEGLLGREDIDPLIAADISQNKAVFDSQEVEIEGEDGKRHKGFATLTPSGKYVGSTVEGQKGKPLNIPAEDSKSSPEMIKAKELAQYGLVADIKDGLEMVYSSRSKSPNDFWADIISKKSVNRFGNNVKPYDMLKNSMVLWSSAKQDNPIPVDIEKTLNTYDLNDRQREELLNLANQINENARLISLSKMAEEEKAASGTANQSFPNTPFYQMPGVNVAGASPAAPAPMPAPAPEPAPQPELQPLTPVAIHAAWSEIQKGTNPKEVQKVLQQEGFDLSPQAVDMMAIEAVNLGVPANVLQQYLTAIGIEWQPHD